MKTAEQQEDDLLVNIGRLSYCANQNDWKRFEMLLRAFTNQVQSEAIESTVKRCAEVVHDRGNSLRGAHMHSGELCSILKREILSLIPQKEKKV